MAIAVFAGGFILQGVDAAARAEPTTEIDDLTREYKIKAAFLYNFAKFTEWPELTFDDPTTPFRICVLGEDPFGDLLYSIVGKKVRERDIAISALGDIADTDMCQLLFISESEIADLPEILRGVSERPVLTVSDIDGFANTGGMIALRTVDNKIRFTVNLEATRNAAMALSPQVLRLADIVSRVNTADGQDSSRAVQ